MSEILYRNPVVEDAQEIVDFYNYVGGETSYLSFEKDEYPLNLEAQIEDIKSTNSSPINEMILAIGDGKIIGIGTINSSNKIKCRHCGELGIVVAKEYQGKGIGTTIIQKLIDWAKANGVTTRIQLDTRKDNESAIRLYEKFGFEMEGCLKNQTLLNGTYYDLCVMGMMIK